MSAEAAAELAALDAEFRAFERENLAQLRAVRWDVWRERELTKEWNDRRWAWRKRRAQIRGVAIDLS